MDKREETLIKISLDYKTQYDKTPWWKFKKRRDLKRKWYSTRDLIFRLK